MPLTSNVAPPAMLITVDGNEAVPVNLNVPELTLVAPAYVLAFERVSVPEPLYVRLLPELAPFETAPVIEVFPVPLRVSVRLVALLDRFTVFENLRLPPEMLFVIVKLPLLVSVPLSSRLFEPLKIFPVAPMVLVLAIAFAPLKSVEAEVVTPFHATVPPLPNAASFPKESVPLLSVVAPV